MLFLQNAWGLQTPRHAQLFGEPVKWIDTVRKVELMIDTQYMCLAHANQVGKKIESVHVGLSL